MGFPPSKLVIPYDHHIGKRDGVTFDLAPENHFEHFFENDGFYDGIEGTEMTMIPEPGDYMAFMHPLHSDYDT